MNDRAAYANANATRLPLADKSVHMIATSPPYWGLRTYDTGPNKHAELGAEKVHDCGAWARRSIIGFRGVPEFEEDGDGNAVFVGRPPEPVYGPPAPPCGVCYVCNLRTWAAEMWRVLRDDGTLWLNLADSYSSGGQRAISYGTSDKEPEDCLGRDCSSENPYDACRGELPRKSHSDVRRVAKQSLSPSVPNPANRGFATDHLPTSDSAPPDFRNATATQGLAPSLGHESAQHRASQASTNGQSSLPPLAGYSQMDSRASSQYGNGAFFGESQEFSRKRAYPFSRRLTWLSIRGLFGRKRYTILTGGSSAHRTEDMVYDSYPYLDSSTTPNHAQPLPAKNLCGIPWRVALALQADGWYLRSDCIWEKPNAMPSSVKDRPSTSHEYIFLLTKRARYHWDNEAVKELAAEPTRTRSDKFGGAAHRERGQHSEGGLFTGASTRNLRTVWTINTVPFSGAHFATWAPALVERMVKAGSSERGVCPECGAPWQRVVDKGEAVNAPRNPNDALPYTAGGATNHGNGATTLHKVRQVETVEWRPTCTCNRDGLDLQPDDFEIIPTPTGSRAGTDPSLIVGRAGYSRPRGDNEGQRPITRYEQRHYARQIRQSADKGQMANEAGPAFSHYVRTDSSGARPIPQDLLDRWIDVGWLGRVAVPEFRPHAPVPAIVLDPFCGSGTTLEVARQLGRIGLGFDLSETYLRDNAAVRLGHDKLAAWGRGIVDTGDYSDLFRARPNGNGATE